MHFTMTTFTSYSTTIRKMKAYSLMFTLVEIMLEHMKNILKFDNRINFKYEGMLAHSFDRFYVDTKFILPPVSDLKFSSLNP